MTLTWLTTANALKRFTVSWKRWGYREGQCFDRKRRKEANELAQSLVGEANDPRGGLLLIGVDDNGTVVGLNAACNAT